MEKNNLCLEIVQKKLTESKGIEALQLLKVDEKRQLLEIETLAEGKIAYGMCKTYNELIYNLTFIYSTRDTFNLCVIRHFTNKIIFVEVIDSIIAYSSS